MTDLRTSRLGLHAVDDAEAQRIVARAAGPGDAWVEDFPFEGDVTAVTMLLRATAARGNQRPFGYYRIVRLLLGVAAEHGGDHGPGGRRTGERRVAADARPSGVRART